MDFWNRNKVRELEDALKEKDREIERQKTRIHMEEMRIKIEEEFAGCCAKCSHAEKSVVFLPKGYYKKYNCRKGCKCKDFQRKEVDS